MTLPRRGPATNLRPAGAHALKERSQRLRNEIENAIAHYSGDEDFAKDVAERISDEDIDAIDRSMFENP